MPDFTLFTVGPYFFGFTFDLAHVACTLAGCAALYVLYLIHDRGLVLNR